MNCGVAAQKLANNGFLVEVDRDNFCTEKTPPAVGVLDEVSDTASKVGIGARVIGVAGFQGKSQNFRVVCTQGQKHTSLQSEGAGCDILRWLFMLHLVV